MVRLLHVLTPVPDPVWREVLAADPEALVTQTPEWLACIRQVGPYADASRLYQFDDGRRIILPLARRRRLPAGWSLEGSWPFDWGVGGPIVDGPVTTEHTTQVYADLLAHPALRRTIRPNPTAHPAWEAAPPGYERTEHLTHILDLAGGYEQVWNQRFRSSVRRAVRKAEATGLRVEVDRTGRLIPVFYQLYQQSVERWGRQQHEPLALTRWRANQANPLTKFESVADQLGQRCATWVAWQDDTPVAAILVLTNSAHSRYWRGAMNATLASPTRANDLLHSRAIADACQRGARSYYMGDSRPGSGLARFKAGFGAAPHTSHSYRSERLPLTPLETRLRSAVKRAIGFKDP